MSIRRPSFGFGTSAGFNEVAAIRSYPSAIPGINRHVVHFTDGRWVVWRSGRLIRVARVETDLHDG
ncbi:hypothetical protein ABIB25_003532 [Nakamurella sp. UYEF19]|uniref:hypothetical protein n=1 Tax=Nakamurella sp. UYEF19 TaxID=1756392 RepID=UPI00339348BC